MTNAVMHNGVAPGQHEFSPISSLLACLVKARKARRPSPRVFFWTFPSIFLALRLKQDLVPDQAVDDPRSKNPLNEH